jgi:hypothetical protein
VSPRLHAIGQYLLVRDRFWRRKWILSRRSRLLVAVLGGTVGVTLAALDRTWLTLTVFGILGVGVVACLTRGVAAMSRGSRREEAAHPENIGST